MNTQRTVLRPQAYNAQIMTMDRMLNSLTLLPRGNPQWFMLGHQIWVTSLMKSTYTVLRNIEMLNSIIILLNHGLQNIPCQTTFP